jgi:hypothetical protein
MAYLELYPDIKSTLQWPPCRGSDDLILYAGQDVRYFRTLLPSAVDFPKDCPELRYSVSPRLSSGMYLDTNTGIVKVDGLKLFLRPSKAYTFSVIVGEDVFTCQLNIRIAPPLLSAQLFYTVHQVDTDYILPFEVQDAPRLPKGITLNKSSKLTICGKELIPQPETMYDFLTENGFKYTVFITIYEPPTIQPFSSADIVLTVTQKDELLTVLKTTGGVQPLKYEVMPDLPPGITLNRSTGKLYIAGQDLIPGKKSLTYTFTVEDTSLVQAVERVNHNIWVLRPPRAYFQFSCAVIGTRLLKPKPKAKTVNIGLIANVRTEFSVLKGFSSAPLTYYISEGSLPDFLALNPSTGILTGIPTAGTKPFDFTLAVKDSNGVSAVFKCPLTIVVQSQACFPGKAVAKLANGTFRPVSDLKIGDVVYTGIDRLSEVYLFTHALARAETPFIELSTVNGCTIVLSAGHYLYVNGLLEKAENVKINDRLETEWGTSEVTRVDDVRETGLYNPHTLDGNILIDGVLTSTYTDALHPILAHGILAPVRYLYLLGRN